MARVHEEVQRATATALKIGELEAEILRLRGIVLEKEEMYSDLQIKYMSERDYSEKRILSINNMLDEQDLLIDTLRECLKAVL